MIDIENIPAEVIAEIKASFPTMNFELYGTEVDTETRSFKLTHRTHQPLDGPTEWIDDSYKPCFVTSDTHEMITHYVVRMSQNNVKSVDSCSYLDLIT